MSSERELHAHLSQEAKGSRFCASQRTPLDPLTPERAAWLRTGARQSKGQPVPALLAAAGLPVMPQSWSST